MNPEGADVALPEGGEAAGRGGPSAGAEAAAGSAVPAGGAGGAAAPTLPQVEAGAPAKRGSLRVLGAGNVGALALISLLNDAAAEMIFPLLPLFLAGTLGAGPTFLGLIEGIAETTASLGKVAGGHLSDRFGRRKALVAWGYGLAALARPLVALATAPWHVLAVRFTDRVGKGLRTAPRDALLVDSVPPDVRGAAFGLHRGADHAGAIVGPLLASLVLLAFPGRLRLVFALALIPGLLSLVILWRGVTERRGSGGAAADLAPGGESATTAGRSDHTPASDPPRAPGEAPRERPLGLAEDPPSSDPAHPPIQPLGRAFGAYLAVVVVFTLGNASDAFLLLRAAELGVTAAAVPLLWVLLHVAKALCSVPGGLVSDRFGPRPVIAAGWIVYAAVYAGFAAASRPWQAWALFVAYGLYFGLTEAPQRALVAHFAAESARARAFGWFHAAVGVAALPASLLFGWIWERWGSGAALLVSASWAVGAAALLALAVRTRGGGAAHDGG